MWNCVKGKPSASRMFYGTNEVMTCLAQQILFDGVSKALGYNHVGDGSSFMQFTGLLDKYGVPIYEGDILQLDRALSNQTIPSYVVSHDGVDYILNHHGRMDGERWGKLSRITDADIINSFGQMVVIGNIHEQHTK